MNRKYQSADPASNKNSIFKSMSIYNEGKSKLTRKKSMGTGEKKALRKDRKGLKRTGSFHGSQKTNMYETKSSFQSLEESSKKLWQSLDYMEKVMSKGVVQTLIGSIKDLVDIIININPLLESCYQSYASISISVTDKGLKELMEGYNALMLSLSQLMQWSDDLTQSIGPDAVIPETPQKQFFVTLVNNSCKKFISLLEENLKNPPTPKCETASDHPINQLTINHDILRNHSERNLTKNKGDTNEHNDEDDDILKTLCTPPPKPPKPPVLDLPAWFNDYEKELKNFGIGRLAFKLNLEDTDKQLHDRKSLDCTSHSLSNSLNSLLSASSEECLLDGKPFPATPLKNLEKNEVNKNSPKMKQFNTKLDDIISNSPFNSPILASGRNRKILQTISTTTTHIHNNQEITNNTQTIIAKIPNSHRANFIANKSVDSWNSSGKIPFKHIDANNDSIPPPLPPKKKHVEEYMDVFKFFGFSASPSSSSSSLSPSSSSNHLDLSEVVMRKQFNNKQNLLNSHFHGTNTKSANNIHKNNFLSVNNVKGYQSNIGINHSTNNINHNIHKSASDSSHETFMTSCNKSNNNTNHITTNSTPVKSPVKNINAVLNNSSFNIDSELHKSNDHKDLKSNDYDDDDVLFSSDVSQYLVFKKPGEDGCEVQGGTVDGLIVHAAISTDFLFQEAFLATYRIFISPQQLVNKLLVIYRYYSNHNTRNSKSMFNNHKSNASFDSTTSTLHRSKQQGGSVDVVDSNKLSVSGLQNNIGSTKSDNCINEIDTMTNESSKTGHNVNIKKNQWTAFSLILRVVDDVCTDTDADVIKLVSSLVYELVEKGELKEAKKLWERCMDKLILRHHRIHTTSKLLTSYQLSSREQSILDFKSLHLAQQLTLLDFELFQKIDISEVLLWSRKQIEELSPNLTTFTEHFNKVSYWCRTRVLDKDDAKEREKLMNKFIKIMKNLRQMNNYNSYLAILSALYSNPVARLDWSKHITETLKELHKVIDCSSSFRAYRQILANTQPPAIPYIGLILQDLTFIHIGNKDHLKDDDDDKKDKTEKKVNFHKCWQLFAIISSMLKFKKSTRYNIKRDVRISCLFNNFDNALSEEAMWQRSLMLKPRVKKNDDTKKHSKSNAFRSSGNKVCSDNVVERSSVNSSQTDGHISHSSYSDRSSKSSQS